jgi:hypothetical protein
MVNLREKDDMDRYGWVAKKGRWVPVDAWLNQIDELSAKRDRCLREMAVYVKKDWLLRKIDQRPKTELLSVLERWLAMRIKRQAVTPTAKVRIQTYRTVFQ